MSTAQALLAATIAVPLALLVAWLWPAARRHMPGLLWLAPLPGLATALLAGGAAPLVLDADGLRFTLGLEPAAALLLGAAALLWSMAAVYADAYLGRGRDAERFAAWWLVTLSGSLGVFVAQDLLTFYLAFAAVSLAAVGLIVQDGTHRARRAGAVTLLLAVIGEVCLLLAFALMADAAPGPSLAIADALAALPDAPSRGLVLPLLIAGFGLKAGMVPLHVWLPLAHPAAPMPASAVLSGVVVKAGIIGLLRFMPLEATPAEWGWVLAALGLITAFWAVGCGIAQANPKTVLAYSTVSQMGVVVAALGMGLVLAEPATPMAAAFYAAHHALAKGALFLAVGVAAAASGRRRAWLVLLPAMVLALGFGGMPLTGGALAKAAVKPQLGAGLVGVLAALSAAGSTMLMLHFMRRLAASAPGGEGAALPPARLLLPWLVLAVAALLLPWQFYGLAGAGEPWAVMTEDPVKTLGPVLLGGVLAALLARRAGIIGAVPEGDILQLGRPAARGLSACGAIVARGEAVLRGWPAAGLALLGLVLALAAAMLAAG
jgi:formate hydrogenlyase subunit 3/multisubunit Na+/H+ antiporter MnhD subunit